jgi:Calcineurin-like phosphoesterase
MPDRMRMVGWFDPGQLVRTGVEVLVSTMFGRHADHRILEALGRPDPEPHDYTVHEDGQPRRSMWIDYVGDVGDGWNSTYAVAHTLAQPTVRVIDRGTEVRTSRGDLLVFGGDQVYPTASNSEYRRRLVAPYEAALGRTSAPHPDVFAIPGNHDWYDSLVSFTRQFCSQRWLGGWRTRQRCSYFALKLPHGWWLLGTDVQLGSDVDTAQVEFFRGIEQQMRPEDRIIVCHAEPHWIASAAYAKWDPDASERNLVYLEEKVLGRRVRVFIAGDLHHYRRHEAPDGTQKITCGGGGAFLHPTHGPRVDAIPERGLDGQVRRTFTLAPGSSYPSWRRSWWLTWRNLAFPVLNPQLAVFTAVIYVVLGWAVVGPIAGFGAMTLAEAVGVIGSELSRRVGMTLVLLGLVAGVVLFTDTHSKTQRIVGGGLHGLAHLAAIFASGWTGARLIERWWPGALHDGLASSSGWPSGARSWRRSSSDYICSSHSTCCAATATRPSRRCASRTGRAFCGCTSTSTARCGSIRSGSAGCHVAGGAPRTLAASTPPSCSRTIRGRRRQSSSSRRSRSPAARRRPTRRFGPPAGRPPGAALFAVTAKRD